MIYTNSFPIHFSPLAREEAQVNGPYVRFTVLTSRLLRMEFSPAGSFEDRPSQVFWCREQPVPPFDIRRDEDLIEIETVHLILRYRTSDQGFSAESLSIVLKESGVIWHYGEEDPLNLKGTVRTLDDVDGATALEQGLISRSGWTLWDDSQQLLFTPDGWLTPRKGEEDYQDLYFFGYGHDYYVCLQEFSQVAGDVPMIPGWALGNWWSRYWAYAAGELLSLMDEFKAHHIPLSVCIVDMDWHIVDTGNNSSGWTGYSWNRELFPDPPAFIAALHERGLKTALNLHPAEGIHPHEDQYEKMAELMGVDPESGTPIRFDIGDPQFTKAYFEELHHPYEAQGIDFWWLDWQQGTVSGLPGLDPLWWLNHLHFYDLGRDGQKRPFIFSRWGGLGNHRYPIGFSGDAIVSWDSLAFQPYFTATAANVNYGWWSHDIGGHMGGVEDAELYTRWVQFGVFSPILRLHSTNNPYHERRPWGYDAETERVTSAALRLRHALLPYLQSMAWRNHVDGIPLIRPMYYEQPLDEQAYHCPNQYLFGSELIAAPFTSPANLDTRLSRQVIWLPTGEWFDFFTGDLVHGDAWHAIYGGLDDIPVFARAGAIVPLMRSLDRDERTSRELLEINLFPGASGSFALFSENESMAASITTITHEWHGRDWIVQIDPPHGEDALSLATRTYAVRFRGVHGDVMTTAESGDRSLDIHTEYDPESNSLHLSIITVSAPDTLTVTLATEKETLLAADDRKMRTGRKMLQAFRMNSNVKLQLATQLAKIEADPTLLAACQLALTSDQFQAVAELMTGVGAQRIDKYDGSGEVLVFWNNDSTGSARQNFVANDFTGQAELIEGPLPKFAILAIEEAKLSYHVGTQPAGGRVTVEGWFAGLLHRIPKEQVGDVNAIIQFDITGSYGCQRFLVFDQGRVSLHEGAHPQPLVTITAGSEDWLALVNGGVAADYLFLSGKLQVGGNFEIIAGLVDVLGIAPPGKYMRDKWRLDVSYFDVLVHQFGED